MFGEPLPPKPALTPPRAAAQPAVAMPAPGPRRVDSATLLGPGGELFIHHQQQVYRLRLTSQGKLILTK
jgi:hemin uptake protein HemP